MELVISRQRPVVAVGECMLELSRPRPRPRPTGGAERLGDGWRLGVAGDTYNTAVYLRRLGLPVTYLTALGVDPYSSEMLDVWQAEGLDTSLVLRDPQRLPGMYAIHTDSSGERSFSYWRSNSAARALFQLPGVDGSLTIASQAGLLYLSGITLSLFGRDERAKLWGLAQTVRANGGCVAFDPNYRPAGWSLPEHARAAFEAIAPSVSIALPSLDDEQRLYGDRDADAVLDRWQAWGVPEVALKQGDRGCLLASGSGRSQVPAMTVAQVVDTTGAGDAFNAAYLAARAKGLAPSVAAEQGARLAAKVIQHSGAILPR